MGRFPLLYVRAAACYTDYSEKRRMTKFPLVINLNKKMGERLVLYPHHLVVALFIFACFIWWIVAVLALL